MEIRVVCYEGYAANEVPRALFLGERRVEVAEVRDRWRGEKYDYFKLAASDGDIYIVRYARAEDRWDLVLVESPDPRAGPASGPPPT